MSRRNTNQHSPAPQYPERDRQTYDAIMGVNPQPRQGPRFAEEQILQRGQLLEPFKGGTSPDAERRYIAEIANGRSPIADGSVASRGPSWAAIRTEEQASFGSAAASFGDPGRATPYSRRPRPGYTDGETITPLDGLACGERQNTHMLAVQARNPRNRRNPASVFGAEDVR
jgi:hypothetical protein